MSPGAEGSAQAGHEGEVGARGGQQRVARVAARVDAAGPLGRVAFVAGAQVHVAAGEYEEFAGPADVDRAQAAHAVRVVHEGDVAPGARLDHRRHATGDAASPERSTSS